MLNTNSIEAFAGFPIPAELPYYHKIDNYLHHSAPYECKRFLFLHVEIELKHIATQPHEDQYESMQMFI